MAPPEHTIRLFTPIESEFRAIRSRLMERSKAGLRISKLFALQNARAPKGGENNMLNGINSSIAGNKNIYLIVGVVVILLIGGIFVLTNNSSSPIATPDETSLNNDETQSESEIMDDHMMMGLGYIMKDGVMMIEEGDNFTPMTEGVILDDGTTVSVNGQVTKQDGTVYTLGEGESMWTDGMFMEAMEMMDDNSFMDSTSSGLSSRYIDYSNNNFATASKNNGKVVLFFAALGWCPSCQAADKDFKANFDKVPQNVSILRVDYDNDSEMKKKYAIVMQDTFVQVDSNGDEITRWNGGGQGVKSLLANLK